MPIYSPEDCLRIRDLTADDIPLINSYWAGLGAEDIRRLSLDPDKLQSATISVERFSKLKAVPHRFRKSQRLIWDLNGNAVGANWMNSIRYGESGEIHLHIFNPILRRSGYGRRFFAMALHEYFKRFALELIVCEPSVDNPGPNRLLKRLGFTIVKTYRTTPSPINYEHLVNRYEIRRDQALPNGMDFER